MGNERQGGIDLPISPSRPIQVWPIRLAGVKPGALVLKRRLRGCAGSHFGGGGGAPNSTSCSSASQTCTAAYRGLIDAGAATIRADPAALEAIVFVESAGRPDVVAGPDPAAASGLAQILAERDLFLRAVQSGRPGRDDDSLGSRCRGSPPG